MNIEVGEYVRLDRCQGIRKIDDYDEENNLYILDEEIADEYGDVTWFLDLNDVISHSKNIIDLIEVGDYVNSKKVLEKIEKSFLEVSSSDIGNNRIYNYMIKSIVTKQQFKNIEYRV